MGATERQKRRRIWHRIRVYSWCGLSGNALRSRWDWTHFAHSPQHVTDTDMRGVSDPAVGLGAADAVRGRGRSRPILGCDIRAGALTGRHNAPPALTGPSATT
jgi:hypothetical protein